MNSLHTILDQLNYFTTKQIIAQGVDPSYAGLWLHRHVHDGSIFRVCRGVYITKTRHLELVHKNLRHHWLYDIACNVIQKNAVISHETALALHQIIPEMVTSTICVYRKHPITIATPRGRTVYRHITSQFWGGYHTQTIGEFSYHIATAEKALFDRLWRRKDIVREDSWFVELRLEFDMLDYDLFVGRVQRSDSPKMNRILSHLTTIRGS